jgi:hypothetical protein
MSKNTIALECRQTDSLNVINNGDWTTTLAKPVELADGDTMLINRSFIDTTSDSNSKTVIPENIKATIYFYPYLSSIVQPGVAIADSGKSYESAPVRTADNEFGCDGFDYFWCRNNASDSYGASMRWITVISLRSSYYNQTTKHYMGDLSPQKNDYLLLNYTDNNGNIQSYNLEVPKTHIPFLGTTIDVPVSFIANVDKPLYPGNPDKWGGENGQNVDTELKNIKIVTTQLPVDNTFEPLQVSRDIYIDAGSYNSADMLAVLNDQLQNASVNGQQSTAAADNPNNPLLKQVNGVNYGTESFFVSSNVTETTGRFLRPSQANGANTQNWWFGSSQCNLDFDIASNKYFFKFLHMPFYNTTGAITSTLQTDSTSTKDFFVGKNSGLCISSFEAVYNDPSSPNYNKPYDFWHAQLGFDPSVCTAGHSMQKATTVISGVNYLMPIMKNWLNGVSTTTARAYIDDVVDKIDNYWRVPSVKIVNTSEFTQPIVAQQSVLNTIQLGYGYFVIEISGGLSPDLIGAVSINQNISAIVNRYYSLGSYTSGDESQSMVYTHSGPSVYLKDLKIRILDSDKNLALNLDPDNTIYINIIKAQ